jgi:hypothetical protein
VWNTLPTLTNEKRMCRKNQRTIVDDKQKTNERNTKLLDNNLLGKTLSREKTHTLKKFQCIIQQLNGYNILQSLYALNESVQQ